MEDIINFQIKDFGPINECDMNLGKINIIGGPNASGKSTASKLLYCFLKASCNQRQDFAYACLSNSIRRLNNKLSDDFRYGMRNRGSDFFDLYHDYELLKENYISSPEYPNKFIDKEIQDIDEDVVEIQYNGDSFYVSLLNNLLPMEFSMENLFGFVSFNEESDENAFFDIRDFSRMDLSLEQSIDESYTPKNYLDIYDVFYIDSFSIFDLGRRPIELFSRNMKYYDHVDYLRLLIRDIEDDSREYNDKRRNRDIIDVQEKIEKVIGGKFEFKNRRFNFNSKDNGPLSMQETASGIKQIGVIQLLLKGRKLKEDSFLILDEPEVNLHPEWQFKLAEILVLLVKDLNISLYINTHSPMFIEAMEVFTKYYDLKDDTYYYLTKLDKDSVRTGYKFKYIDIDDMQELYDNLSDPYNQIDDFRLKANFKQYDS